MLGGEPIVDAESGESSSHNLLKQVTIAASGQPIFRDSLSKLTYLSLSGEPAINPPPARRNQRKTTSISASARPTMSPQQRRQLLLPPRNRT